MEDSTSYIPLPTGPINEKNTLGVQPKATKLVQKERPSPPVTQQEKHTSTRESKGRPITSLEETPLAEDFEAHNLLPPYVPP